MHKSASMIERLIQKPTVKFCIRFSCSNFWMNVMLFNNIKKYYSVILKSETITFLDQHFSFKSERLNGRLWVSDWLTVWLTDWRADLGQQVVWLPSACWAAGSSTSGRRRGRRPPWRCPSWSARSRGSRVWPWQTQSLKHTHKQIKVNS